MERLKKLPVPGQRIIRSVLSVWLCFVVYLLRGKSGIPLYSTLAVMQCLQPYTKAMRPVARKRIVGTVIGAFWGLLLLLIELELISDGIPDELLHYVLVGLFAGIVLYSTVLMKLTEASYFSTVVFLVITINHISDANPYLFAFNRLLDTVIGVGIAEIVNRLHMPRVRHTDTLYVSAIGNTILGPDRKLAPYTKVELNRLLDDGAKFTVATSETQATVRELLAGVELCWPIITMNGAALYDMKTMEYLRTVPMAEIQARRLIEWARGQELSFFSNSVEENLLVVRYASLANAAMQQLFDKKRKSPYRNFVHTPADLYENILYLLILDETAVIEAAYARLMSEPWAAEYRVVQGISEYNGFSYLKIYDATVSREAMLRHLEEYMKTSETLTFGPVDGQYDVTIASPDRDRLAKELKRRFEPVDLRGWKNMFHH